MVYGCQRWGDPAVVGRTFGGFTLCRSRGEADTLARNYRAAGWNVAVVQARTGFRKI